MTDQIPICTHCWIEVIKEPDRGTVIIGESRAPRWMHKTDRSATGNPSCGRQFLEDEEIEYVDSVTD